MKTFFFQFILLLLSTEFMLAQDNLVLNPGFEQSHKLKNGMFKIKPSNEHIVNWRAPIKAEQYLFSSPKEYVAAANSGNNAIGLVLGSTKKKDQSSFITGNLRSPLQQGQTYCICFYLLLHRTSKLAATDIGLILHRDTDLISSISDPSLLKATLYANNKEAISHTKWTKYCGIYQAIGGEKHLSFGKFGNTHSVAMKDLGISPFPETDGHENQAFYQLDDLSIKAIESETECDCNAKLPIAVSETEKSIHTPILFAVDASHSMDRLGLFDTLAVKLNDYVDQLPDKSPISMVTFSNSAQKLYSGIKNENTSQIINQKIQSIPRKGATNVLAGLKLAYASRPTNEPDFARLVFISDGRFRITPEIIELVKHQYERYHRTLHIIQIGPVAQGLEQLYPYTSADIHISLTEINQLIRVIDQKSTNGLNAIECACTEEYGASSNYHFVIDYSGSMREENSASISGIRYLYDAVPDSSFVSFTLFNHQSTPIYAGLKSNFSVDELEDKLVHYRVMGGTSPEMGVGSALEIAKDNCFDRINALVIITDLATVELSLQRSTCRSISETAEVIDLSASVVHFFQADLYGKDFRTMISQFDMVSETFYTVSKKKFEKDLFHPDRSKCDYKSQPYHRGKTKRAAGIFIEELLREYDYNEYNFQNDK